MSDSNSESPYSESKPKPCFSHLPWFLKQQIVDNTDIITRLRLRKLSKELLHCVDKSSFNIEWIIVCIFNDNLSRMMIKATKESVEQGMTYTKGDFHQKTNDARRGARLECPDPTQRLIKDLATLFKNRNTTLNSASIHYGRNKKNKQFETYNKRWFAASRKTFEEEFGRLGHQLNVTALTVKTAIEDDAMFFLQLVKPGVLRRLRICDKDGPVRDESKLLRIRETEQCKQTEAGKLW